MPHKLVIGLWLLVISLFSPVLAFAQESTPSASLPTTAYQLPPTISPTSPIFTDLLAYNLFHTFSCLAVGGSVIGQPCLTYQVTKNAQGMVQSVPMLSQVDTSGGVLGTTTNLIGALYAHPPVRTADYLASVGQDLGIAKEAHAQVVGTGADVLSPILPLWKVSRDISYVIMVVIFVIIGLMVMFRQRINPQTVITAQAALPGLVIGLILITFSYFLAGLISDMAFVGTNVVGYYFSSVRGDDVPQDLVQDSAGTNILGILSKYVGIINKEDAAVAVGNIWSELDEWVRLTLRGIASAVAAQFLLPFGGLAGGVGQVIAGVAAAVVTNLAPEGLVGWLLSVIAMIILIYSMLKLLLKLIQVYLLIIFLTLAAPFHFLAAALPGRQGIATSWIQNMLSNALAFPAVLAVIYFVAFILNKPTGPLRVSDSGSLIPMALAQGTAQIDVVGTATFPLFGGMDLGFVKILLAFGALVALPAIPDVIARTIGKVGVAGQLLGQEYEKEVAGGRGYYGQFSNTPAGFAREVGNLKDEPFRHASLDPTTKKVVWNEEWEPVPGVGSPTQGRASRIRYSAPAQWLGGLFKGKKTS